jgi:hypothetical protein
MRKPNFISNQHDMSIFFLLGLMRRIRRTLHHKTSTRSGLLSMLRSRPLGLVWHCQPFFFVARQISGGRRGRSACRLNTPYPPNLPSATGQVARAGRLHSILNQPFVPTALLHEGMELRRNDGLSHRNHPQRTARKSMEKVGHDIAISM